MKILPIEKIREADAYTIEHEPVSDLDLMERAATELFEWIRAKAEPDNKFRIFCGLGNNGGDGFVLARLLGKLGYEVEILIVKYADKMSPSCEANYKKAKDIQNVTITEVSNKLELKKIEKEDIIVDAIFGSGLTRPVTGFIGQVVDFINDTDSIVVAIDAPSGFFCDRSNTDNEGSIIQADYTLTFQFPKLGFVFPENEKYIGHWEVLPIGLHPDFIKTTLVKNHFITTDICRSIYKPRTKFAHKGTYGHGLMIAGSTGKMGAAVLATKAGLKAGAGLITSHIPGSGNVILQSTVPAAMVSIDEDENIFSKHPELTKYNAIAVGPGLGMDQQTESALKLLIQNSGKPIIFDADALNILAENQTWISFIPQNSILTPHPGEFERLIGSSRDNFERNEMQREFSIKHNVYVIMKGAHTAVTCPDGTCYYNSTGNPGMATAGCGDVLTGILLGLKAQGYTSFETSILGVYLHGLAGDIAAEKWGYEALTANNITHYLGKAYSILSHK